VPWRRRLFADLSPRRPGLVLVGFVADIVALGQVFLQVILFSLSITFHRSSPYTYITPGSVHVGFVVDTVALGQVFLLVILFSLSLTFHRSSPYSYVTWEMDKMPVGGRSLET
jgi:hypothetical protein